MVETLTEMQKLRMEATTERDFNRQSFAQEMIDRMRYVKSEIVNAQGTQTLKFQRLIFNHS